MHHLVMTAGSGHDDTAARLYRLGKNDVGSDVAGIVGGVVIGIIGLIGCGVNYPIYKKMLEKGKAKYAYEIVQLAKEIADE